MDFFGAFNHNYIVVKTLWCHMALSFCNYNQYHDLMVFTQILNFQKCIFNHPKLGNNKIPFILATFGE